MKGGYKMNTSWPEFSASRFIFSRDSQKFGHSSVPAQCEVVAKKSEYIPISLYTWYKFNLCKTHKNDTTAFDTNKLQNSN